MARPARGRPRRSCSHGPACCTDGRSHRDQTRPSTSGGRRLGVAEGISRVGARPGAPALIAVVAGTLRSGPISAIAGLQQALGVVGRTRRRRPRAPPNPRSSARLGARRTHGRGLRRAPGCRLHLEPRLRGDVPRGRGRARAPLPSRHDRGGAPARRRWPVASAVLRRGGGDHDHRRGRRVGAGARARLAIRRRPCIGRARGGRPRRRRRVCSPCSSGPAALTVDTSKDAFLRRARLDDLLVENYEVRFREGLRRFAPWATLPLAAIGTLQVHSFTRRFLVAWAVFTRGRGAGRIRRRDGSRPSGSWRSASRCRSSPPWRSPGSGSAPTAPLAVGGGHRGAAGAARGAGAQHPAAPDAVHLPRRSGRGDPRRTHRMDASRRHAARVRRRRRRSNRDVPRDQHREHRPRRRAARAGRRRLRVRGHAGRSRGPTTDRARRPRVRHVDSRITLADLPSGELGDLRGPRVERRTSSSTSDGTLATWAGDDDGSRLRRRCSHRCPTPGRCPRAATSWRPSSPVAIAITALAALALLWLIGSGWAWWTFEDRVAAIAAAPAFGVASDHDRRARRGAARRGPRRLAGSGARVSPRARRRPCPACRAGEAAR